MNEKIKQLAEEAGFETDRGPLIVSAPYIRVGGLCVGVPLEKFAELIIDECCLKLLDMDEKTKGNHNYYKHAAIQVKKHFGVNNDA